MPPWDHRQPGRPCESANAASRASARVTSRTEPRCARGTRVRPARRRRPPKTERGSTPGVCTGAPRILPARSLPRPLGDGRRQWRAGRSGRSWHAAVDGEPGAAQAGGIVGLLKPTESPSVGCSEYRGQGYGIGGDYGQQTRSVVGALHEAGRVREPDATLGYRTVPRLSRRSPASSVQHGRETPVCTRACALALSI